MMKKLFKSIIRTQIPKRALIQTRAFSAVPEAFQIGRLNHVAIATPNLQKSADFYKTVLGAKVSEPLAQPEHGVTVVFVELPNTKIELITPLGEKSPIKGFLEKNQSV